MLASPGAQVPEVMQILVLFVATQQGNGTFRCLMNVAFEEEVVISMCVSYSWGTLFTVFIDSVAGNTVGKKASNQSSYVGEDSLTGSPGKVWESSKQTTFRLFFGLSGLSVSVN